MKASLVLLNYVVGVTSFGVVPSTRVRRVGRLLAQDRGENDDAAPAVTSGSILDEVDFSAFDESEYEDADVELSADLDTGSDGAVGTGSSEGGVEADGQWWDALSNAADDDDQDNEDAKESEEATAWDASMGGTRANPKASGKGASTLPRALKRRPVPLVAILGRPNVGKSMLANRISGKHNRGAIVHDEVGVTRDRTYLRSEWCGSTFDVVDTGGLVFDDDSSSLFLEQIRQQAAIALSEATCAVLVVDGQAGRQPLDEQVAAFLRKEWSSKMPVMVAVNKCESQVTGDLNAADFWSLGLGQPMPVSGIHGSGVAELLDELKPHLYEVSEEELEAEAAQGARTISVALVGRPNVGKSSMFNRLYGAPRAIVSEMSGTTRDTLDAEVEKDGRVYRFVDTAGVRKRGKVQYGSEFFMVNRALKAIRRSDVVVLVLDAVAGVSDQDRVLAERVAADGRACVVALNKWDAVEQKDDKTYLKSVEYVKDSLTAVKWAPVLLVSALTGQRCPKLYAAIDAAVAAHRTRVSTATLNDVVRDAMQWQPPPAMASKGQGKIYYANQISHSPPTFAFFCNRPALFSDNYKRYLERKIRESLSFEGTPLRFVWRGKRVRELGQENKRRQSSARAGTRSK